MLAYIHTCILTSLHTYVHTCTLTYVLSCTCVRTRADRDRQRTGRHVGPYLGSTPRHPRNRDSSSATSVSAGGQQRKDPAFWRAEHDPGLPRKKCLFRGRTSTSSGSRDGFDVVTARVVRSSSVPAGQPRPSPVQLRCAEEGRKLAWEGELVGLESKSPKEPI